MAGYSGTPLPKKLGLATGQRAIAVRAPDHYEDLLAAQPDGVDWKQRLQGQFDFIHLFCVRLRDLEQQLPRVHKALAKTGMLWISWPKKSSSLAQDLSETEVRQLGLDTGLVDVKVCAVDADWSGLKFMYRVKDR